MDNFSKDASLLSSHVDAVFVTESPGARPRVSSLAGCIFLRRIPGVEPVLQLVCIRSNRIALESELMSAAAFGIYNILCLGGDPASLGNRPEAADVRCLDTPGLISLARQIRKAGSPGKAVSSCQSAPFFVGAAADPYAADTEDERLRAKLDAGVDFLVTQPVFEVEGFRLWWERVRPWMEDRFLLAGVLVLGDPRTARRLSGKLPGINIPQRVLERLERSSFPEEEGALIAAETARALREISGLNGIHFMNASGAQSVLAAIRESGLRSH